MSDEHLSSSSAAPPVGGGAPLLTGEHTFDSITDRISGVVLAPGRRPGWIAGFAVCFLLVMMLLAAVAWLFIRGIGIWGVNIPVGWGFAITNFVWWIGIGHAGTLISAILLLFRQDWRTSINRFAEAMTLFAVACAGLFPLLHLGRPKFFYWMIPYPSTMDLWPQFRSPLVWDIFAVTTYATVSLLFWYVGLIPDLATMRDSAQRRWVRKVYGILSLGWRGSARHWRRYEVLYLVLAGLATALVVSVHTVVSFDFSVALLPGWHSALFPPYFVAGAIYSGFAMVLMLAIPVRRIYRIEDFITVRHLDNMARVMLASGLLVAYGYAVELFMAWYSGAGPERFLIFNRMQGPYRWIYWLLLGTNVVIPQLLWMGRVRRSPLPLFLVSASVLVGMWLERFIIVVTALHRDFLPGRWGMYSPTVWDVATLFGTIGLFLALMFLFLRLLPALSMSEMRSLLKGQQAGRTET